MSRHLFSKSRSHKRTFFSIRQSALAIPSATVVFPTPPLVEATINILGLEITGKVGGYAGAVGVEGKVGIEDNKFVLEGGAAALIGGSAGIEIGFNDEGWDNFVDFIVFWD